MAIKRNSKQHQKGIALIEALVAILIFTIGVVGIVGIQGYAVRQIAAAKYRSEASLLANQIIGQMWSSDRTPATLQTNFQSPDGTAYTKWAWAGNISSATSNTGTSTNPADGTVLKTLPGSIPTPPSIVIAADSGGSVPTNLVTVTIYWQEPGDSTTHSYVSIAQIGG